MRKIISFLLLFAALMLPAAAFAQKVTLSGFVRDAASGEGLAGALVYTADLKTGVNTNSSGYYSLELPAADSTLVKCAFTGYVTDSAFVRTRVPARMDFLLSEDQMVLDAARVFSRSKRDELIAPQMGKTSVSPALAKKLPALMGETDIIRVIQMMPGVQTPSEGSTGFSVRGGGIDQNLVLMDGAPLYNTGHFLGFLSMFNSDAVKDAQLYKGDFPAAFGGRMSSVLDVSTKDGNINAFGGNFSIGLIDSKIFLEGPLAKEKAGFFIAGRRTYLDMFFPLFKKRIPQGSAMNFYDLNAKVNWIVGEKDRLSLSAFSGRDVFGFAMKELNLDQMKFVLSNNTQSLKWNHVCGPKLFTNLVAYNSRYDSKLGCLMEQASFDCRQQIREFGVKASADWFLNSWNTLEFGAAVAGYIISPGSTVPTADDSVVNRISMFPINAVQPSVYAQNEQKLGPVTLRYGLRLSTFTTLGRTTQYYFNPESHQLDDVRRFSHGQPIKTFWGLEPRFSLSWDAGRSWAVKAAYSRTYQYLQQAVVSVSGSPVDTWFTASPNVRPQISDQVSAGFNKLFWNDAFDLSLELFYKHNLNTIDFVDNPGFIIDNKEREGLLRSGTSQAFGAELMLKCDLDRWTGWVSYTWSEAYYHIPEINEGRPYRSPLNHRHAVSFVLSFDINKFWTVAGDWVYYSGAPTTFPVGRFKYGGSYVPIYSERNRDKMPDYHRLDLSVTARTKRKVAGQRWGSEFNLSFYNAYSRHNAWSLAFGYNTKEGRAEARKVYLFTIVPSFSYNLSF